MAVNPTGADMKAFLAADPDAPIVMLNLLRFAEGGAERYDAFSDMVRDPGYQEGTHLRTGALVEAVLQPTVPRG